MKSEETIAIEFARHLRHMVIEAGDGGPEAYLLRINPKVTAWFIADGARELHALEGETGRYFHFEGSDGLPLDHFAVTMEGTRAEIEEHAVPFRAGEEVHVQPRRAAHVQRRRRGGQGRRLPDRRRQRHRVRGREEARPDRGGGPHDRPRGAGRRRRRGRRGGRAASAPRAREKALQAARAARPRPRRARRAAASASGRRRHARRRDSPTETPIEAGDRAGGRSRTPSERRSRRRDPRTRSRAAAVPAVTRRTPAAARRPQAAPSDPERRGVAEEPRRAPAAEDAPAPQGRAGARAAGRRRR